MDNENLSLIYKGLSKILDNQKRIIEHIGADYNYGEQETEELSEKFSELSEQCLRRFIEERCSMYLK